MPDPQPEPAARMRPDLAPASEPSGVEHTKRFQPPVSGLGRGAVWGGHTRVDVVVPPPSSALAPAGALSGGGSVHPGAGCADGGDVGPGAYLWWYVDAISDCGQFALTIIAFVGSVFSPYYAWSRARGPAEAEDFCALNVALYGPGCKRWTMTDRGRAHVQRSASEFVLGPSRLHWEHDALVIDIDEVSVPLPRRVRSRVRVHPQGLSNFKAALDDAGRHRWGAIAACARVEVEMDRPSLDWQGHAYLDSNEGDEPIDGPSPNGIGRVPPWPTAAPP